MTQENSKEWADKTAQNMLQSQETTFIDDVRGIRYSLIQQSDVDEVSQVVSESFVQGNEIIKSRGVTVEEYKEMAVIECQMAVNDQLGFIARDVQSNQVVGAALAYTYTSAYNTYAKDKDQVAESSEKMAPVTDIIVKLYNALDKVESFDTDKAVIFEDIARIRDKKFAGKGIGYACFKILYSYIYRQSYTVLIGITFNNCTIQWGSAHAFRKVCSIQLDEYTYRDQKVFSSMVEKGFKSIDLHFKRRE